MWLGASSEKKKVTKYFFSASYREFMKDQFSLFIAAFIKNLLPPSDVLISVEMKWFFEIY